MAAADKRINSLQPKSTLSPYASLYQPYNNNEAFSLFQKCLVYDDMGSSSNQGSLVKSRSSGVSDNFDHGITSSDGRRSVVPSFATTSNNGQSQLSNDSGFGNRINKETTGQSNIRAPPTGYHYGTPYSPSHGGYSNQLNNLFNQNLSVFQNSATEAAPSAAGNNDNRAYSPQNGNIWSNDQLGSSSSMVNQDSLAKFHSGVSGNLNHGNTSLDAISSVPSFAASFSTSHSLSSNDSFASGSNYAPPTGFNYHGSSSSGGRFSNRLISPLNQPVLKNPSMSAASDSTNNLNCGFSGQNSNILSEKALLDALVLFSAQNGNILSKEALLDALVLAKLENWNMQKLHKILTGDATLIYEVHPDELFAMATLRLGSNYLLDILSNSRDGLIPEKITKLIFCNLIRLMSDQFGSAVFKKLLSSVTDEILIKDIVQNMAFQNYALIKAATTELGVSSIQELMKIAKKENKDLVNKLICALANREILVVMKNKCGSRLIKFLLEFLNLHQKELIYSVVMSFQSQLELATDKQGCITLQIIMKNLPNPFRDELLRSISNAAHFLSYHQCGNFVIQHVIKLDSPMYTFTEIICKKLRGHYVPLSKDKCGSYVVEKCIYSTIIGMQLASVDFLTNNTLIELAQNQNGNYVVQTLLGTTKIKDQSLYRMLVFKLKQYSKDIQNHPHGSNVYNLINGGKSNKRRQQTILR
ncbi:pumilio homolog 12-like [Papaver somniferum]|uniref:pumilio homolog 12-like n=1 Tax=Papaver somniferum TaxID=3469 RepID=UPI000E704BFC|nr:pumilio homolog 12-like [Papaver somniferum]